MKCALKIKEIEEDEKLSLKLQDVNAKLIERLKVMNSRIEELNICKTDIE